MDCVKDAEARKKIFDLFIGKAEYFGWSGDKAMLWSAWKRVVWPIAGIGWKKLGE